MGVTEDIAERLEALPESTAVGLLIGADNYFDVIRAVVDIFSTAKNMDCIYISSSIPSQSIINALEMLELNLSRIYFIDCISHMMVGAGTSLERVYYVESPSMLETIMLKVEYLIKKCAGKSKIVFIDSINSLAIHNDIKILSEFLHILVNNMRAKNAYTIILSVEEHTSSEMTKMMSLVCDETIVIEKGK